jgi:hypothetical protein
MSLRDKMRTGLGFFLILSMLWGCENPNQIGLNELKLDTADINVTYKEFVLPTSIIQPDSILTGYSGRLMCGNYHDENFGLLTAKPFFQVLLGDYFPTIPSNAVFDSLVFNLYSNYVFGPGTESDQTYYIYHLSESLQDSIPYFSNSSLQYDPEPIGKISFTALAAADTTMKVYLDSVFGVKLLHDLMDSTTYDHNDGNAFKSFFNGFMMVADPSNNSVIGYDPTSGESSMIIYYQSDSTSGSYTFSFANGVNFNQILTDRSGTPVEGLGTSKYSEFHPADSRAYLQAGTEIIPKIDLKPVLDYIDSIPELIINKATIEIINHNIVSNILPPSSLYLYITDSTNRRKLTTKGTYAAVPTDDNSSTLNLIYDDNIKGYSSSITFYVEQFRYGYTPYDKLLLYPIESALTQSVNQLVVDPGSIKIKLYYTTTKQ